MFNLFLLILIIFLIIDYIVRFNKKINRLEDKIDKLGFHCKEIEMRLERLSNKLDNK